MHKKTIFILSMVLIGLALLTIFVVKQSAQITIKPAEKPLIENNATILPVSESDPMYGNPGGAMTIDEFFSFDCPECAVLHEQLISFVNTHSGKVRLRSTAILKTNWLGQQEEILPALALFCAEKQNAYWQFLDKLLKTSDLEEQPLDNLAKETGLNETQFGSCLKDETAKIAVQNKQNVLQTAGLLETPLLFVDNKQINFNTDVKAIDILTKIISK